MILAFEIELEIMTKAFVIVPFLCIILAVHSSQGSTPTANSVMSIGQATKFCETAVPANCISSTCPTYCNSMNTKQSQDKCITQCTTDKHCKLRPDAANQALHALIRDQLWACIAEKRDPNNTKTGRAETPWEKLSSPSFKKVVGRT